MNARDTLPDGVQAIWLSTRLTRVIGYGVYVFRAGPWLIDAGFRRAQSQLLRWSVLQSVQACLLTHHDEDHVGSGAALADMCIEVLAPPAVAEHVKTGERLLPYQRLIWGTPKRFEATRLEGPIEASGWTLLPLHTPGHASDHYVYHEPERAIVFSGDLYIASRVEVARPAENIGQLVGSLRAVRALQPEIMFCAHRGRVGRPVEALTRKIDWLEEMIGQARVLASQGLGVKEITRRLLGREPFLYWLTWGDFAKYRLIESALHVRR